MKSVSTPSCLLYLLPFLVISGCLGGGGSDGPPPIGNAVSTNYPYLLATPQVSYVQNSFDPSQYDVTVTLNAAGPNPIYAVSLWIQSSNNSGTFTSLDLQSVGGTTWSATTNLYTPLPPGTYYLDSFVLEDGDPFAGSLVRSGWYMINSMLSGTHYMVDQRLTDWGTPSILEHNVGSSNIPVVTFTLP